MPVQSEHLPDGRVISTIGGIADKCSQHKPADNENFIYIDIGSIDRERKTISEPQHLIGKDAPSRA
jgi:type I restriction enzyme S subunit